MIKRLTRTMLHDFKNAFCFVKQVLKSIFLSKDPAKMMFKKTKDAPKKINSDDNIFENSKPANNKAEVTKIEPKSNKINNKDCNNEKDTMLIEPLKKTIKSKEKPFHVNNPLFDVFPKQKNLLKKILTKNHKMSIKRRNKI